MLRMNSPGRQEFVPNKYIICYCHKNMDDLLQVFINFAKNQTDLLDDEIEDVPEDLRVNIDCSGNNHSSCL